MVELEFELGKDGVELSEEDWAEKLSPCLMQENNNNPNSIHMDMKNSGYSFNRMINLMQTFKFQEFAIRPWWIMLYSLP